MTVNNEVFLQVLELHPEILQQILSTVLNVIMFEDCRNQWSMSRPLLGLILLNEEVCSQYRNIFGKVGRKTFGDGTFLFVKRFIVTLTNINTTPDFGRA